MYYIVDTTKSFSQAACDLEKVITRNGYGLLHVHDFGNTLRSKGVGFNSECKIFEVCNPSLASRILQYDMRLNTALPCRISIYTDNGVTKIGMIQPVKMLFALSQDIRMLDIANIVDSDITNIVDAVRA